MLVMSTEKLIAVALPRFGKEMASMTLQAFFRQYPKAALGLSGGVDSAYLLSEGLRCGAEIRPYFVQTPFQPAFEREDAEELARSLGVALTVLPVDILAIPEVASNPEDRCYYCKNALFGALKAAARRDGCEVILDGANASDDALDRPGMRAARELGVLSPLRLCGVTKDEIRRRAKEAGLAVWDKPAYACLATRVPAGQPLDAGLLQRVEQAEAVLFGMGFSDFRVRVFHDAARLQLREDQFSLALEKKELLVRRLKPYFDGLLLDLAVSR